LIFSIVLKVKKLKWVKQNYPRLFNEKVKHWLGTQTGTVASSCKKFGHLAVC
jgi:hypothetical protein